MYLVHHSATIPAYGSSTQFEGSCEVTTKHTYEACASMVRDPMCSWTVCLPCSYAVRCLLDKAYNSVCYPTVTLATYHELSETCLNLTIKVNLEEGRRWLCNMDQLNAKSEVYQDGWYIAVAHLHSIDGREQFQKIVTYLERNNSLAVVKVGEGFLLLATEEQAYQQLDVKRIKNDETPFLYCICLSRQPIILHRGKKPLRNSNFTVASQERTKMESSCQKYADLEISTLIPLSSCLQASDIKEVFSVPFKSAVGDGEDPISLCHGDVVEGKDLEYNNMSSISSSLFSAYSLKSASKTRKTAHVHINKDIKDDNDKSSAKSYKGTWRCHFDRENKQAVSLDGTSKRTRTKSTREHVYQNNDTFIYIKHKKGLNARSLRSKHKWNMEISCPVAKEMDEKKGRIKSWVKANRGKRVSTSSSVTASLTPALAGQESIQFGVPKKVIALKKIPKKNRVRDRFLGLTEKHCPASEVGQEMLANQGMEKQETPCKVNSTISLDIAPTEEDSILTQVLHDNKVDLEYQKSGLYFMSSTLSEADILEKKEAVRTVRIARKLQCHIVNNIATACRFPYIEDNLYHIVKAVLQGPTSGYSCSDVESHIYQSVSSSLHGSQTDGKQFMKKVRVNMTSIQSISFKDILVDLHFCSHIVCGESDVQADSTVDFAKCEMSGIDLVYRKMRSEEDDQQEELDVHRIMDRHHSFPGKVQDVIGEDSERNIACFFLQSKATLSNEGINTPWEIINTDSKHILPLTRRENASKLTGESSEKSKGSAEPNGISDSSPIVDSADTLQTSNNELAVSSDQSLGNNKWLELKASSQSSLSQAAHFHKPLDVNYVPLQQQQQTEVVSSIEIRGQHDQICDKSVIGSSVSTSSVSQVHSEAQAKNYPCVSSFQQIRTVQQTESCLPSLAVSITSSHTPSITTSAKQFDIGSQVNKSESLTINTLSQGNLVSLSSENENKVMNSKKSLTVTVSMNSSAADPSAEIGASLQSLKDDRCKASSHEQKDGRSRKSEDSRRSHRRFHPYKKTRSDPSYSFDLPYRDLAELLQNLTSKTYFQSSKSPRVTNSWNRPASQPARFSSFKFCRSDVPLSLPRSGSPSCADDLNSLTPDMIPNFEERHRTAELLEEHFASRNEETYNKEEFTYQREKHDIPDDLLPAHYPVFEKSKMLMVMTDDTERSFIQDQTDFLIPGSRTTTFSRTLLSDLSVGDKDKIAVDLRDTDIYPLAEDMNDSKDKTSLKKRTTQMQDKNDKKNITFQRRSLVKSPGLDSKIAMDCFPNVTSPPMRSEHGYLHQHASKTDLDSSLVNKGTPCISQCNNPADYKKSEELLSRQQISKNCLYNVNINTHGCSEKFIMEDGDFVNRVTAIIDGKQIQSTVSKNETHQTQTPLQYYQRNYKETKSHGCFDVLQEELTQIDCQSSISQELTDNNPKRSCIHEKRDDIAAEGSGMQQQNQVLATANIGSNRDSLSSMAVKSLQGTVHENVLEHSNTAEKYNSKSYHSYVGRTLTNRNIFSLFETNFFKNEDDSAIVNIFDFSFPLVDSKQNSLETETVTRNEVSASQLFSKDHFVQEPKFAMDDSLQSSVLENKLILSAADAPSIKFDLNSNMPRSFIAKHDVEAEKSIGTQIVSRNSELKIPEVDATTCTNNDINQCLISDRGQDVNGEIFSHVKRQEVHCSFKTEQL